MRIAVLLERAVGERRVAGTPDLVSAMVADGHEVVVETGAGLASGVSDDQYQQAGAFVAADRPSALGFEGIVLTIEGPFQPQDQEGFGSGHVVIGLFDPVWRPKPMLRLAATGAIALSLDLIPRSTRAQSMDVLSSQATVVGYQAVLLAAQRLPRLMPMLMTAAGTVPAARVVVLGAGVAGLQSIAMARRLGAVVEGFDVRSEALEEIRSLGARSIEVAEGDDPFDSAVQEAVLLPRLAEADLVITAAQIPGRASPTLITEKMVEAMRSGCLILDLSVQRGRNCVLAKADEEVEHRGVAILAPTNLASGSATTASRMYSGNMINLIRHLVVDDAIATDRDDEIVSSMLVTCDGSVVHPVVRGVLEDLAPQGAGGGEAQ